MGYNINEVTGAVQNTGADSWTFTVDFDGSGPTEVTGDFDGPNGGEPLNGFTLGALSTTAFGTITFFDPATGEFVFTIDREAFFASGQDQTVTFTITGNDGFFSDTDTVVINLLICVARGTLIETADGPVRVEDLSRGDFVRTTDGGMEPVRWIGSRRVTPFEMRADPGLRPIIIRAGALGAGRPGRDLRVSPQHRILISDWRAELMFGEEEVLVPAKALVNGETIVTDCGLEEVEYFHVLFDRHEIMLTEGLPTESFHPGDYALREIDMDARVELLHLFPDFAHPGGLPDTARMALRPWEGRLLVDRAAPEPMRLAS